MLRQLARFGVVFVLCILSAPAVGAVLPATRPGANSQDVNKGLVWLAKTQLRNGAWGQGDESWAMGSGMATIRDTPNVADTCMALMALYHAGSSPTDGPYRDNIVGAVDFVCGQVEAADDQSLSITTLNGTRTQMKLGQYIDTFMAAQALAEMKGKMDSAQANGRVEAALKKVLHKMEINQKSNGQWAGGGWAPTLAQAQAAKAANIAVQNGAAFDETKRQNAQEFARADIRGHAAGIGGGGAAVAGRFGGDVHTADGLALDSSDMAGNAGVPLYSAAGDIAAMQASANSNSQMRVALEAAAASPTTAPAQREAAQKKIKDIEDNAKDLADAQHVIVERMRDPKFANGFGSNGGEEFLSYLNIGESLFQKGGNDWKGWSDAMTANLERVQNDDGSWSGDHCITGRTFCTAAAVQVLCIDRAPAPAQAGGGLPVQSPSARLSVDSGK
jgi:hypothetical protein